MPPPPTVPHALLPWPVLSRKKQARGRHESSTTAGQDTQGCRPGGGNRWIRRGSTRIERWLTAKACIGWASRHAAGKAGVGWPGRVRRFQAVLALRLARGRACGPVAPPQSTLPRACRAHGSVNPASSPEARLWQA
ncbi:hypothetical protein GQ55_3G078700 [Panicum hallii var. hallii]|uniref:Uncharacterized protein n=1 Tax=Panicum hallii var. hallii TaxID=1504633 RepID=A0A2T7E6W7_9POAL|nr:hypothetical protein GQ55_3G078700 [Panicum hallii var. hallii]